MGTAVDAQEPSQGLKVGPALDLNGADHLLPLKITKAAVVGQPRVRGRSYFVAACPTGDAGLGFESFAIDPQSLALGSAGTFAANIPEGNTACLHTVNMTAGRFTTDLHDQLLVTYGMEGNVKVLPFDLTDQGIAMQQPIYDTGYIVGEGFSFVVGGLIGAVLWIGRRCSSRITLPGHQHPAHPQLRSEFHHAGRAGVAGWRGRRVRQ